jgi:hypothetical protein
MKLQSLLLSLVAVPILSMSLPARSEPPLNANIALAQQQVDEVVDFGIRKFKAPPLANQKAFKIDVMVPLGHRKFIITPANPFNLNTHQGQIDANRHGEIDARLNSSELSIGNHQKVVTILTDRKLIIKRVLLKVTVITSNTVPSLPNSDPRTQPQSN